MVSSRGLGPALLLALGAVLPSGLGAEIVPARLVTREATISQPAQAGASFRFLPDGRSLPFDRPLVLGAAPGEERSYLVEITSGDLVLRRDFLIDRRPPPPPRSSFPSGSYEGPLRLELSTEAGSGIRYALAGPGIVSTSFRAWDVGRPIVLPAPASSTATWVLIAHAIDAFGNRGSDARFVWRLGPANFAAESPAVEEERRAPRAEPRFDPGQARVSYANGRTSLAFAAPASGARLVASVGPGPAIGNDEAWAPLATVGNEEVLDLDCPYGWEGDFEVFMGIDAGGIVYRPQPIKVRVSDAGPPEKRVAAPLAPRRLDGAAGTASYLSFAPYDGDILVSVDGGAEAVYRDPLPLAPGEGGLHLSWRGRDSSGTGSDRRESDFDRPPSFPPLALIGAAGPDRRATAVTLRAPGSRLVRYELGKEGIPPPEPGASSKILDGELKLDAEAGTTVTWILRYRPYSGPGPAAVAGDTLTLRFTIDREAPERPWLVTNPPPHSSEPLSLSLASGEGRIFASLSESPDAGSFTEVRSALELPGSSEGPRTWYLRAYAVDEAGNRSNFLGPLRYVVDTACVYVDASVGEGGTGSPERPFSDLAVALSAALGADRHILRLRGDFSLAAPLVLDSGWLSIEGGYGEDWSARASTSSLVLAPPSIGSSSLRVSGAALSLASVDLVAGLGAGAVLELTNSSVRLDGARLAGRSQSSLVLISAAGSRLSLSSSVLSLEGRGGGALVVAESSSLVIDGSDLVAGSTIDYFTGLSLARGSLVLTGSRLHGSAGLSLVAIAAEGATVTIDRSSISASGGAGYFRCLRLASTTGEFRNSHVEVSGPGAALLFELRDSPLSFIHDTVVVEGGPARGVMFDATGAAPRLVNDILIWSSAAVPGGAVLLRSDRLPGPGTIQASALRGFASYLSGVSEITDAGAFAAQVAAAGSQPLVFLSPSQGLVPSPKNGLRPGPGFPGIDAGLVLAGAAYAADFSGLPRPSAWGKGLPDMGADELH